MRCLPRSHGAFAFVGRAGSAQHHRLGGILVKFVGRADRTDLLTAVLSLRGPSPDRVCAIRHCAHRADHAVGRQIVLVVIAAELTGTIRI